MDPSAASEEDNSQPTSLPEEWFNIAILCKAFAYKAMNALGTLATIWATVVLLGGFSTLIKQPDFWYVTAIAFVQSIGILGGYEDTAHQIYVRAPEALRKDDKRTADWEQKMSWWRRRIQQPQEKAGRGERRKQEQLKIQAEEEEKRGTTRFRRFLGRAIQVALLLGQVAAVATIMALSSKRLSKQDFVDPMYRYSDDHRNIRRSLNIFYGLVLAQGVIFILINLNPLFIYLRRRVQDKYTLFLPSDEKFLLRYENDNYLEFIIGNVRTTLNMDLVTFAKKLAVSDSVDDQLAGIRAMDRILRSVKYRSLALMRLRASLDADASGKLVDMLSLISTTKEQSIRGHATRVVLKLAPDLLVESFPQILQLISSSLLSTVNKKMDVDLVWFGLRILDKLTENPDNCRHAEKAGDLLSKIIDLTNLCGHGTISDSWIEEEIIPLLLREDDIPPSYIQKIDREIIVGMSLNILSKLVAMRPAPDDAGEKLRRKTSESVHLFSNTGMILEHVEATRVIACLALDKTARADIGRSPEIIKKLKDCLLSKTPHVNITKVAAKLLLLDCTGERPSPIESFIAGKHILEDQSLLLPVSAIIEELDLKMPYAEYAEYAEQMLDLEDLLKAPRVNHSEAAAEALVLLTTGCEENVAAVLEEINLQELQMIVRMLSSENGEKSRRMSTRLEGCNLHSETSRIIKKIISAEDGEHRRSMDAKLLQNFRSYSGANKFDQYMQVIDEALPKVLKEIVDEVAKLEDTASTNKNPADEKDDLPIKEGKVLESFIGLAVQICTSQNATDFARTLEGASLTVDTFVQKLKKILEVYKSPTTDFPGIRRSTVELMIWMIKNKCNYRESFLQCGLYEQLKEVANTGRKLESFELFHCGVGVAPYSTPISSLARELMAQLALSPCFQERSRCYGEHASTITVLVA